MRVLLFLLALLVAPSVWAFTVDNDLSCTGQPGACVEFDSTDSTDDQVIGLKRGKWYYIVFDPHTGGTGADDAEIQIFGPCAATPATVNTCEKLLTNTSGSGFADETLDGGDASDGSQRRVLYSIPGGLYLIDVTTAAGAGDAAVVSFEGQ